MQRDFAPPQHIITRFSTRRLLDLAPVLTIAVNPYHLTLRELPAMASLLLADKAVTALPTPPGGDTREDVQRAMVNCPRYTRLLESWRWASPLWRCGAVTSLHEGDDAMADVRGAMTTMASDPACKPLHPFLHKDMLTRPDELLDHLCADLLKGGPDPGFCVPVAGAMDRFAARHGLLVTRSGRDAASGKSVSAASGSTASLVQRAEEMLGRTVFTLALPVLASASGRTLEDLRADLEPELSPLRQAISETASAAAETSTAATVQAQQRRIREAGAVYAQAFEDVIGGMLDRDDDRGIRVTAATCRIVCRVLPADAVVRSSVAALRTARRVGLLNRDEPDAAIATETPEASRAVITLVVSAMPRE